MKKFKNTNLFMLILLSSSIFINHKHRLNKNIKNEITQRNIPKIIHITYTNKNKVPQKVWANFKKYCSDYEVLFYSDDNCRRFLKEYYGVSYVKKFDEIPLGAHKADFFRYCVLYIKGGVYMDIKLNPKLNISEIIDHNQNGLLYTCLGSKEKIFKKFYKIFKPKKKNGHIFQAIIATFPKNRLMKILIDDFFKFPQPVYYNLYTILFYDLLRKENKGKLSTGDHYLKDQKVILFMEVNKKMISGEFKNRYNGYHNIIYGKRHIFQSRYHDFPWE
jgi:mannosyltransferase OCH1-like enzyme